MTAISAEPMMQRARHYMSEGRADLAVDSLRDLTGPDCQNPELWTLLGFALHEEQRTPEAVNALSRAYEFDRHNPDTAMALAQSLFLAGFPSAGAFERVRQLAPHDLNVLHGHASALAAEGQTDTAINLLMDALNHHPDWMAGQKCLASLRYTGGDSEHFADTLAEACRRQPDNLPLWLEWFRTEAQVRHWDSARRIVNAAEQRFGDIAQLKTAELFIASESGDDTRAAELFAETESVNDLVRDMALIRYSLRQGDPDTAERTALRYIDTRSAPVIWPYLSLVWRLKGDERADWLDRQGQLANIFKLDLTDEELASTADLLRSLHTARSPYAEQSVRGGTQTDLNLFLRHEPPIQSLKAKVQRAVQRYVETLPEPEPGHPLLGVDRGQASKGRIHFSGSWSVRLRSQGYNVSHTHPVGWISSALYVSLPEPEQMGAPPAGWLQLGSPPPELQLDLEPYRKVEPKAAHLVLFPSTMWHSTVPFNDGERLVVAFDVRAPQPVKPTGSVS